VTSRRRAPLSAAFAQRRSAPQSPRRSIRAETISTAIPAPQHSRRDDQHRNPRADRRHEPEAQPHVHVGAYEHSARPHSPEGVTTPHAAAPISADALRILPNAVPMRRPSIPPSGPRSSHSNAVALNIAAAAVPSASPRYPMNRMRTSCAAGACSCVRSTQGLSRPPCRQPGGALTVRWHPVVRLCGGPIRGVARGDIRPIRGASVR
jgi:hypothetical protein